MQFMVVPETLVRNLYESTDDLSEESTALKGGGHHCYKMAPCSVVGSSNNIVNCLVLEKVQGS